ncbi:DUF5946 family protein [Streptosporangium sp. NPDC020072]|uniref:DUF5946 family protein n=1 Tax=Streptosporangium sp. NPDC020072 TaxID=3154788 RepID=UPI003434C037
MTRCPECGAPTRPHSCQELFEIVLALDHSRLPPWGSLHGVTVSCFLLQHPSRLLGAAPTRPWTILHTYLDGGLTAVTRLTEHTRRANSHRDTRPSEAVFGAPVTLIPPPTAFSVTIHDVAQDGTFPAEGFPERLTAWAKDCITGWSSLST